MNEPAVLPFGPGALTFIGFYLAALLVLGWLGGRARREDTLRDFYLGGGSTGLLVLFLTLYATQYSGNTLFGFSGKAYRVGFSWITCVHFMTAITVGYLLFAPALHARSRQHGYITPQDFLHHRYRSRLFDLVGPLVMIAALANFLLAQLIAMGRALQGLTTLPDHTAFVWGVVLLAGVMLVYETLGGFRAVAWTDVIQGVILMSGIVALTGMILVRYGGLGDATRMLLEEGSATRDRVLPPDGPALRSWLSYILIFGLGAALYPQAIQRLYAARSARVLARSLALMAFMPLLTAGFAVLVGVVGAAHHPGLTGSDSDRILTLLCREIQQASPLGHALVVLLFSAVLAALMSTADSCLLTISSMATKDVYQRFLNPDASEASLTRMGKVLSWVVVAVAAGIAIWLETRPATPTLVRLLDLKFDLLVQFVPAFMLGIHWHRLRGGPVCAGFLTGLAVTYSLYGNEAVARSGFHHGLYGLAANLAVAIAGSLHRPRNRSGEPGPGAPVLRSDGPPADGDR